MASERLNMTKMISGTKFTKKGYSTGFTWVFSLVTLFGLGILYIVFTQVFEAHLVPVIKGMTNGSLASFTIDVATQATINQSIDKYMSFFHILPFVLFFVVVIYMIVAAIRSEGESRNY